MSQKSELIIDSKLTRRAYYKDLWGYRELFYFLAWRDILVRYKQAFFGIAWALVRPMLNVVAFALLFGKVAKLPSDNINYPLFVLAGLLPWQLFSNTAVDACNSLVINVPLVSKTYFPRIIIPLATIIVHLLDFTVIAIPFLLLAVFLGLMPIWSIIAFPFFLLLTLMLCTGTSLWLSAITVNYRDFRIVVPFLVQFGLFASPVGYGTALIPEQWQWLYCLNPMAGIIDGFRWACFGISHDFTFYSISMSVAVTTTLLLSGLNYFRKVEYTFADTI
jgi:lipopolysaccharide transport system permease protein